MCQMKMNVSESRNIREKNIPRAQDASVSRGPAIISLLPSLPYPKRGGCVCDVGAVRRCCCLCTCIPDVIIVCS